LLAREGDINLMDMVQGKVLLGPDAKPMKQPTTRFEDRVQERLLAEADKTAPFFILGTSVLFEIVMLAGAAWIFCRRDF
jgi:hypothetical protein